MTKADLMTRAEDPPSRMLGSEGRNHWGQLHGLLVTQGTELRIRIPSARSSPTIPQEHDEIQAGGNQGGLRQATE